MGFTPSAQTVTAEAYLTELGRTYLFDQLDTPRYITLANGQTVDRLKIASFSMGDPDVNYNSPNLLLSGEVPDLSGDSDQSIKGAKGRFLNNLISPGESNIPNQNANTVVYKSSQKNIIFDLSQTLNTIPMVVNQQLMTYIDGVLNDDGLYFVTPNSYGNNKIESNELIIVLQEPTFTLPGYRLRIFFPTTGVNYNLMTFQFESSPALISATATKTVNQTFVATQNTSISHATTYTAQ